MADPQTRGRLVDHGRLNIAKSDPRTQWHADLYHFLLTVSWTRLLLILATLYVAINSLFALGYLLQPGDIENASPGSFADAFFFSVQTMATIGYGKLAPHTAFANELVAIESLVGLLGIAMVTGIAFAKFSRPTSRVLFSRVAVMTRRDGVPCLMFRVANRRGNQIVEARVHVVLALTETTLEGEVIRRLHDLALHRDQNALFVLSWTVIHPITETSPLFRATADWLTAREAEIIVSLTGLDETFSQTVHARHSYVAEEIVWGARFVDILSRTPDGRRRVDYARFHDVVHDKVG
ncbi:MAG TPA: ion channel [Candidatus Binatia bacterium]|nr:ion channel [Candidatus Binatia bacterium]